MSDEKDVEIEDLFMENGICLNPIETYFDKYGDVIEGSLIAAHYHDFPSESDLVKLYYAQEYADETNGNYTALKLFRRANFELF